MINFRRLLFVLLVVELFGFSVAQAEFRCESRIGYTVEFAPKREATPSPGKTVTPAAPAESRTSTVYLSVVEARGADEAKAKSALQKTSAHQMEKVREECRERHENVGGCISSKYATNAPTLRALGFSARKALEEALQGDCETQRGICKKVEATEPVCAEIVLAVPSPSAAGDGKEDKKKGKK